MEKDKFNEYLNCFNEDLAGLKADLEKTKKYQEIIDSNISDLSNSTGIRGGQHYLIEHIKNAISLETQVMSIRKTIIDTKKIALDYTLKDKTSEGSDMDAINAAVQKLIDEKNNLSTSSFNDTNQETDLDVEIEKLLEEDEENGNM